MTKLSLNKKYFVSFLLLLISISLISQINLHDSHYVVNKKYKPIDCDSNYERGCPNMIDSFYVWRIEDGNVRNLQEKQILKYASNGEECYKEQLFNWDSINQSWDIGYKWEFELFISGNLKSVIQSTFENNWRYASKSNFKYDSKGTLIQKESFEYDTVLSIWQLLSIEKRDIIYNSSNNIIEIQSRESANSETWENKQKWIFDYNAEGERITEQLFVWNGLNWIEDVKMDFWYDEQSDTITSITYQWNTGWTPHIKSVYIIAEDRGFKFLEWHIWNTNISEWDNGEQTNWEYDLNGNLVERVSKTWNQTYQEWIFSNKDMYDYNNENVKISHIQYYFDYDQDTWVQRYEDQFSNYVSPHSYNVTITGDSEVPANSAHIYKVLDPGIIYCEWNVTNGQILSFPDSISVEIKWSDNDSGHLSVEATNIVGCLSDTASIEVSFWPTWIDKTAIEYGVEIYPNPVNDQLTIKSQNIEISLIIINSISGKEILIEKVDDKIHRIDLSTLPSGVYLVNIQTKSKSIRQKIVKN